MEAKKVFGLVAKNPNKVVKSSNQRSSSITSRLKRTHSVPNICRSQSFHNIFSQGKILHAIQMSNLYKDSKTFVDMTARWPQEQVISNFEKLGPQPSIDELKSFVSENFYEVGYDLVKVEPTDWHEVAPFMQKLTSEKALNFGKFLNCKWRTLLRNFDRSKIKHQGATTALCTKNSFIVPGGRFIEYYYWDTFWIVEGLLSSGMFITTRGIIENFIEIVKTHGFVPNGSRVYYLNRSQPPLLTKMVEAYFRATNDIKFLEECLPHLDTEYNFWMRRKAVKVKHNGETHRLNWYKVKSNQPRPESYREDIHNAMLSGNQEFYFSNIITATESGWDFSSRWFDDPMDIKTIQIVNIIPVDLNSIMHQNEICLKEFHALFNNAKKAHFYGKAAKKRQHAINSILWNHESNSWGDYNVKNKKIQSRNLYITDLSPLWSDIEPPIDPEIILSRYKSLIFEHISGIPASNIATGQQWDFPNVWAPYHYWIVDYFLKQNRYAEAKDVAERFVNTVYVGWLRTNYIFEKYSANELGVYGGGGEYVVQEGFGWTNGCVIKFLDWFGDDLKLNDKYLTMLDVLNKNMCLSIEESMRATRDEMADVVAKDMIEHVKRKLSLIAEANPNTRVEQMHKLSEEDELEIVDENNNNNSNNEAALKNKRLIESFQSSIKIDS